MYKEGVIMQPGWLSVYCPFCFAKLNLVQVLQRRIRKVCKCRSCGRKIEERYMFR